MRFFEGLALLVLLVLLAKLGRKGEDPEDVNTPREKLVRIGKNRREPSVD